jgi:hypothetical protein
MTKRKGVVYIKAAAAITRPPTAPINAAPVGAAPLTLAVDGEYGAFVTL